MTCLYCIIQDSVGHSGSMGQPCVRSGKYIHRSAICSMSTWLPYVFKHHHLLYIVFISFTVHMHINIYWLVGIYFHEITVIMCIYGHPVKDSMCTCVGWAFVVAPSILLIHIYLYIYLNNGHQAKNLSQTHAKAHRHGDSAEFVYYIYIYIILFNVS